MLHENLYSLTKIANTNSHIRSTKDTLKSEDKPIRIPNQLLTDLDGCCKKRLSIRVQPIFSAKMHTYILPPQDSMEYNMHKQYKRRLSRNKVTQQVAYGCVPFSMREVIQMRNSFDG